MADDVGRQLLDLLSQQVFRAFQDAAAAVADRLAGLAVDERFTGTPYAGRVLTVLTADHPALAVFTKLTADDGPSHFGLHGWRAEPADGAPLGLAFVAASGAGAVALLSVVPSAGPQLTLRASGLAGSEMVRAPLGAGFTLTLGGQSADEVEVVFHPQAAPTPSRLADGDRVEIGLSRTQRGERFGPEAGPSIQFGQVSIGGYVAGAGGGFERGGHLRIEGGDVALAPGFLKDMLPLDLSFPLDLDLRLAPGAGFSLGGSPALATRLSGAQGRRLDLALGLPAAGEPPGLRASFRTSLSLTLPGTPLNIQVDGLGFGLPISLAPGTSPLPDPLSLGPEVPSGMGVAVDLPVVGGTGVLSRVGDDMVGALSVRIPPMSASAFGLLSPKSASAPLSFLVIMGAMFPPPGVQIGFGFAITGLGGVVGVNRRVDREALLRAIADGTAAQLLFPSDPVKAGQAAIAALPGIFPAARGSIVAGPMFQIGWGGRMISLSVAVLVEASGAARVTIVGKLVLALPDPQAPLVYLQASFAGFIDPGEPSVMFVASLVGSHIVGMPLTGDLLLLTRGGSDPTLVLSAGGFHPAFPVPRGIPALRRLSMDMCPVPWLSMRCESYFALTSNTLQLGVRLELSAEVAGCGLRGYFAFDALVQYSPFRFVADISGGIALRAFGETLMGVNLALHLEGPAPYLARGRGSIDLFLFEVSFDFEIGWGSPAPQVAARNVGPDLIAALAAPESWRSRSTAPAALRLTDQAQKALSSGTLVDPYGAVSVRQEAVPLGVELRRYGGVPCPPQIWDLTGGEFGPDKPVRTLGEIRAQFAPGQFIGAKSDDEALTAQAFLPLRAGVELYPGTGAESEPRPAELTWEESVIAVEAPKPVRAPLGVLLESMRAEALLAIKAFHDGAWWPDTSDIVAVEPVPPVVAALSWSMTSANVSAHTGLELKQAVSVSGDIMALETWEL